VLLLLVVVDQTVQRAESHREYGIDLRGNSMIVRNSHSDHSVQLRLRPDSSDRGRVRILRCRLIRLNSLSRALRVSKWQFN